MSVKDEPIYDSQSISETKEVRAMKVKEEPINAQIEKRSEEEEKFSKTEEFTNTLSMAFLDEETTTTTTRDNNPTRSNSKSK